MKKTIGILAHVDAGKTTLSESILYKTNVIRNKGRVDHKNSYLDNNVIEKERGITIYSDQAAFEINDSKYYLIDTPGHIDFSPEMERAVKVLDYAIVLISAIDGIQSNTRLIYEILKKNNIPMFFFINKADREDLDINKILSDMKNTFTSDIFYIDYDLSKNELSEELIEFICDYDEELMEKYLSGEYDKEIYLEALSKLIKDRKVSIVSKGSALIDTGIDTFLNNLETLTYTTYKEKDDFSAVVYKVRYHKNNNADKRITYLKVLSGTLCVKDEIKKGEIKEKINSLYLCSGDKFSSVNEAVAGDLIACEGLSLFNAGEYIGTDNKHLDYSIIPSLMSKVILPDSYNIKEALKIFKILEAENPELNILWNEVSKEIHIHIMGKIQLEILKEVLKERFNLNADFGQCTIIYKETIKGSVNGYGHFEPLRHYAEVILKIEAAKRNSGISFSSVCPLEHLPLGQQNLIRTHIFEKKHKGILTGSELTDLNITLIDGRNHLKHTSGGDFREATLRALRQGLEKAENILLEPYYKFEIDVPLNCMGKILMDIQKMDGEFSEPVIDGERVYIQGSGPVKTFMDYPVEIAIMSKGEGNIVLINDGYRECHNSLEVIEGINYNKDADIEYTSSSVFCSKGQGYIVPWNEVKEKMHSLRK